VRRNRRRFWKAATDDPADKAAAYHTLHTCLVTVASLLAPFTPFVADRLHDDLTRSQDPDAAVSVHLLDFPTARDDWRDEPLRAAMATIRRVTELGRQARNDSGVKVRQPLARALVTVPEHERAAVAPLLSEVADELNVKRIELSDGTGDLVERSLKPNFRNLGPAFQKDAPKVAGALSRADAATSDRIATELSATGAADVDVDGDTVTVDTTMVEVVETPRTGWSLAADAATSFALDTELDDDLRLEGAARELVRAVNDLRKAADLELDARIELHLQVAPESLHTDLDDAGWLTFLAREVLADRMGDRPGDDAATVDLNGLGTAHVRLA
jgi:isoleucyl-tRNA synthetase